MIHNYEVLRQSLTTMIQKSNLDIGAIYFICKDVFRDVEMAYANAVNSGLAEQNKKNNQRDPLEETPAE